MSKKKSPAAELRTPLSKKTRFEIFKRDLFTCQYCGAQPPAVVLEVDHIEPVASGGKSHELNLVTACEHCNRGKGARKLANVQPRPDADLALLKAQQEIVEAQRFLQTHEQAVETRGKVVRALQAYWAETLGDQFYPADRVLIAWLSRFAPEEIVSAIDKLAPILASDPNKFTHFSGKLRYLAGIIYRSREEAQASA